MDRVKQAIKFDRYILVFAAVIGTAGLLLFRCDGWWHWLGAGVVAAAGVHVWMAHEVAVAPYYEEWVSRSVGVSTTTPPGATDSEPSHPAPLRTAPLASLTYAGPLPASVDRVAPARG